MRADGDLHPIPLDTRSGCTGLGWGSVLSEVGIRSRYACPACSAEGAGLECAPAQAASERWSPGAVACAEVGFELHLRAG